MEQDGEPWDEDRIRRVREKHLGPALVLEHAEEPLHIVRAQGSYMYAADGTAYLDGRNNVCQVGHCHPRVVRAVCEQMATLNTNTRYLHSNLALYAQRLSDLLPPGLEACYFVNSGSEANDLALRIARAATGGTHCLVVEGAYHGHTCSTVDLSPYKTDHPRAPSAAPAWVHKVPTPDTYRGLYRHPRDGEDLRALGARYARHVEDVLLSLSTTDRVAAFFCESIMGCAGQVVPAPGFLLDAYAAVRRAGGLCVADEVQTGFGRVGSHMWGFELHGVVPDIVTLGKPMGNGFPLAAVVTRADIAGRFTGVEYFNTYGGNPVACAAGLAVLDVMRDERLQENALRIGSYLAASLKRLQATHASIGDVRGAGMFIGVDLVADARERAPASRLAARVVAAMKRTERILIGTDGPFDNVLKIKPPLTWGREEADRFVGALDRCLAGDASAP